MNSNNILEIEKLWSEFISSLFLHRTLEERAQRLFSTKGKSLEALDPSLFAKNPKTKGIKRWVHKGHSQVGADPISGI